MPDSIDELLRNANVAHAAGRLSDAENIAKRVLLSDPENTAAYLLLGVVAGKTGHNILALEHFEKVLAHNPQSYEALFWASMLHRKEKRPEIALDYGERALRLRPNDAYSLNNIGMCYMDLLRLDEAVEMFRTAAEIRPDMAPIYFNLGTVLYLIGRDMESAIAFDRALALAPQNVDAWLSLGQVLISQTNPEAAIVCAKRAIALNPKLATAHLLMASAQVENSKTGLAEIHLKKAIDLDENDAKAHALLGQRLQSLGRFEEANHHLQQSLQLEPRQGFAYFAYVHNNKITESDRNLLDKMEALVAENNLPPREMNFLQYGLGRSYESLKQYEKAMAFFDQANLLAKKIKFGGEKLDREAYKKRFDWHIETFTPDFFERNCKQGCPSNLPVVIMGMMRSGTTLAEQILSSHPKIGAAGEHRFWPLNWPQIFGEDGDQFDPAKLPHFGKLYVDNLKSVASGFPHVTDKMPANYEFLGLIHAALPNAKFIHMRRNPVDTCVSIYATPNRVSVDFAYDRANIVFAYQQYERLMNHWRSVLPTDRFLEVNYEDLVIDRRTQIERMLEHCGLPWDDSVLHHESNHRNVNTPSLWQVRQPIYTSSMERWRGYEPWLGEFKDLM